MPRAVHPHSVSHRSVQRLVGECVDAVETRLGFRPDVHLELRAGRGVSRAVADAVRDALDLSLGRVADHRGSTSAFVTVSERTDTIEVFVVDDGRCVRPRDGGRGRSPRSLVVACGVEHDVDDFGAAGICQWWSIPLDLAA